MTTAELKERYVYAATRRLPSKTKKDIAKELETLIDDMLLERCGDSTPAEKDLRVIIAELGQPSEIHHKYSPLADKALIAPPYYEPYIFIIKIVAACVFCGISLAIAISSIVGGQPPIAALFSWFTTLAISLAIGFSFVTILFAIFSQMGVNLNDFDNEINNLQPVPKSNLRISKGESIVNIVMYVIFAILMLALPSIITLVINGSKTPIFNVATVRSAWVWIILFAAVGIFKEAVALIDGKYTKRLLYVTLGTNLLALVCAIIIFSRDSIINAGAILAVLASSNSTHHVLLNIVSNFNWYFLGLIALILILEAGEGLFKYLKIEK